MSTGHIWRKKRAARDLAQHLELIRARTTPLPQIVPEGEDNRTTWRRRLQQRKCLVCGARDLVNQKTSYFCIHCKPDWRYCSTCETLRTSLEHGKDSRCKGCSSAKALAEYYADKDRTLYRLRLGLIAKRTQTRADQIFDGIRRRIALAELVRQTPGMSWTKRGRILHADPSHLSRSYEQQCAGTCRDVDAIDQARRAYYGDC